MMKQLFLLISFSLTQIAYTQWEWQSPRPQGNTLLNVQFIDTSLGWAVGEYGTIIKTIDGGKNWQSQENGRTDDILSCSMISATTGWAVGDNGTILHTSDAGENWIEQLSGITTGLNCITFFDQLNGWASGDQETILHTTNGGESWTIQHQIVGQISINSISFLSLTDGWAVGSKGKVYHTTDGGSTWTMQTLGSISTIHLNITFADNLLGFIVGSGGSVLRTDNGGVSWSTINTGDANNCNRICMLNTFIGWIACDAGKILRTVNGGLSWSISTITSGENLNGLSRNGNYLWAVGEYGKILKSSNNGISWSNLDSGSRLSINWISFASANVGTAVGPEGSLLRTTDGGASWQQLSSPTPPLSSFGVSMIDETHGCAAGEEGNILRTTNGITWIQQSSPTTHTLFGINFGSQTDGWIVGGDPVNYTGIILHSSDAGANWSTQNSSMPHMVYGVSFISSLVGWVVGDFGIIYKTTNGGVTWNPQNSNVGTVLYWCTFADENNGWAVGDSGKIIHTTDGGASWNLQTSGTNLILFSIANNGINEAVAVGDSGIIFQTSDGGEHWSTQYSRTLYPLYSIANNGTYTSCGDYGTILNLKIDTIVQLGSVTGNLFFDLNQNGIKDSDECGLAGWDVTISGAQSKQTTTNNNGDFNFADLQLGNYTVSQVLKPGWTNTVPGLPSGYSFTLTTLFPDYTCRFGNYVPSFITVNLNSGWNIISLPLNVIDPSTSIIYPNAVSPAYLFDDGYRSADTLLTGIGYWIKFSSSFTNYITGTSFIEDTILIKSGWNIIGSVSEPLSINSIVSSPAGIVSSQYFGYESGYYPSDTLKPGNGYWVKASEQGNLILSRIASSNQNEKSSSENVLSSLNRLTISDATGKSQMLYFTDNSEQVIKIDKFTIPPLPPEDAFDIRFNNNSQIFQFNGIQKNEAQIDIRSYTPPLKLEWDLVNENHNIFSLCKSVSGQSIVSLNSKSGSTIISNIGLKNLFLISERSNINLPSKHSLSQNYPNPFNPATDIKYQISDLCHVTIKVYNIIGVEIATLVDWIEQAGYKSVIFDASNLPSGVYYCKLTAWNPSASSDQGFIDVKKMILVR